MIVRFGHSTRRWPSWHLQSGTSLPGLMELGGWKSYEMVLRYAHLAPEKLSWSPAALSDSRLGLTAMRRART
jgi:hypothetical protein